MAIILDGKNIALSTEESLKLRVSALYKKNKFVPILATILVGFDPASATYVKMKRNACERIGMKSIKVELEIISLWYEYLKACSSSSDEW